MGEFAMLHHEDDPVDADFHDFRKKHNRVYKDKMEHQKRKHIFRHNLRCVTLTSVSYNQSLKDIQSEPMKTRRRYVQSAQSAEKRLFASRYSFLIGGKCGTSILNQSQSAVVYNHGNGKFLSTLEWSSMACY